MRSSNSPLDLLQLILSASPLGEEFGPRQDGQVLTTAEVRLVLDPRVIRSMYCLVRALLDYLRWMALQDKTKGGGDAERPLGVICERNQATRRDAEHDLPRPFILTCF